MDTASPIKTQTHRLPQLTHNLKAGAENAAENSASSNKNDEITSVAQKFEALLLHSMLKSMRASIVEDELTGSDQHNLYRDMMDQEVAKNISEAGGIGIQAVLATQLGANQQPELQSDTTGKLPGTNKSTTEPGNAPSKARLEQLQQYQKMSGANDLMINTQSSLMQN